MTRAATALPVVALVWAGVTIGGSMIAAPSKFQAASLTLAQTLEVGRAQFFWLGVAESLLCAALIGVIALRPANARLRMGAPILVFGIQWLIVMPFLDDRTVRRIAGEPVGESHLHLVFVVLDILKVVMLIAVGVAALRLTQDEAEHVADDHTG